MASMERNLSTLREGLEVAAPPLSKNPIRFGTETQAAEAAEFSVGRSAQAPVDGRCSAPAPLHLHKSAHELAWTVDWSEGA